MIIQILPQAGDKWCDICLNLLTMKLGKLLNIADLIRKPRQQLNLSQEKLAASLGVSLRTVNRWENTSAVPSQMALKLIEEMLEKMGEPRNKLLTESLSKARQREDS